MHFDLLARLEMALTQRQPSIFKEASSSKSLIHCYCPASSFPLKLSSLQSFSFPQPSFLVGCFEGQTSQWFVSTSK
jgi:hypothetical protein